MNSGNLSQWGILRVQAHGKGYQKRTPLHFSCWRTFLHSNLIWNSSRREELSHHPSHDFSFNVFTFSSTSLPYFSNLLFSRSAVSDSFKTPWTVAHARLPCLSLSLGVCSNTCLLSQWCHPAISPSITFFSFCSQSFPASGSFPMSNNTPHDVLFHVCMMTWSCSVMSDSLWTMDCSLPGSFVHGIFQARVLEWVATSFSNVCMTNP